MATNNSDNISNINSDNMLNNDMNYNIDNNSSNTTNSNSTDNTNINTVNNINTSDNQTLFSDYHGEYADIINLERPVHIDDEFAAKHPPIPRADRAKIFASFAALKDNLTSRD